MSTLIKKDPFKSRFDRETSIGAITLADAQAVGEEELSKLGDEAGEKLTSGNLSDSKLEDDIKEARDSFRKVAYNPAVQAGLGIMATQAPHGTAVAGAAYAGIGVAETAFAVAEPGIDVIMWADGALGNPLKKAFKKDAEDEKGIDPKELEKLRQKVSSISAQMKKARDERRAIEKEYERIEEKYSHDPLSFRNLSAASQWVIKRQNYLRSRNFYNKQKEKYAKGDIDKKYLDKAKSNYEQYKKWYDADTKKLKITSNRKRFHFLHYIAKPLMNAESNEAYRRERKIAEEKAKASGKNFTSSDEEKIRLKYIELKKKKGALIDKYKKFAFDQMKKVEKLEDEKRELALKKAKKAFEEALKKPKKLSKGERFKLDSKKLARLIVQAKAGDKDSQNILTSFLFLTNSKMIKALDNYYLVGRGIPLADAKKESSKLGKEKAKKWGALIDKAVELSSKMKPVQVKNPQKSLPFSAIENTIEKAAEEVEFKLGNIAEQDSGFSGLLVLRNGKIIDAENVYNRPTHKKARSGWLVDSFGRVYAGKWI